MTQTELSKKKGSDGEFAIIDILKKMGVQHIRRPDFCFYSKKRWYAVEVKNKEPFEPPPAYMQGIPRSQYYKDLDIDATGLCCILAVRGNDNEWLAQYVAQLHSSDDPRTTKIIPDDLIWFNLSEFKPLWSFFMGVLT
jgi:hypothetical protein